MENTINSNNKLVSGLNYILQAIIFAYLFLILSFGRSFSITSIGPVFITEIGLLFVLSFIAVNIKRLSDIPRNFSISLLVYFVFCSMHMAISLLGANFNSLRDIVFFGYILFLPAFFIISFNKKRIVIFLRIIILTNIIGLTLTRLCMYRQYPAFAGLVYWWSNTRAFNYLLYYSFSLAFLVPLFFLAKKNIYKLLIAMVCSWNLYTILMWGSRTGWVVCFTLGLFLLVMFRKRIIIFLFYFVPIFIISSTLMGYFVDRDVFLEKVNAPKLESLKFFIKEKFFSIEPAYPADNKEIKSNSSGSKEPIAQDAILAQEKQPVEEIKIIKGYDRDKKTIIIEKVAVADKATKIELIRNRDYFANIAWRLNTWKHLLDFGIKSPILGRGLGVHYRKLHLLYDSSELKTKSLFVPAHNHIVSIFYKTGFIGLGLFMFINIYAFLYGFVYLRECKDVFIKHFLVGVLGSFVAWHTMAFFFNIIDSPPTSIFLWVIIGLIFACVKADNNGLAQVK